MEQALIARGVPIRDGLLSFGGMTGLRKMGGTREFLKAYQARGDNQGKKVIWYYTANPDSLEWGYRGAGCSKRMSKGAMQALRTTSTHACGGSGRPRCRRPHSGSA